MVKIIIISIMMAAVTAGCGKTGSSKMIQTADETSVISGYDEDEATIIDLSNYSDTAELNEAGTYIITGELSDGSLIINCGEDDEIHEYLPFAEFSLLCHSSSIARCCSRYVPHGVLFSTIEPT